MERREVDWDSAVHRFRESFPQLVDRPWVAALADMEMLGRLIRDVLSTDTETQGRGPRKHPNPERSEGLINSLVGSDYATVPFAQILPMLLDAQNITVDDLAARLPFDRSHLDDCLTGERPVDVWTLHEVGKALGKRGDFFVEYRTAALGSMVMFELERNPDVSATWMDRVTRRCV